MSLGHCRDECVVFISERSEFEFIAPSSTASIAGNAGPPGISAFPTNLVFTRVANSVDVVAPRNLGLPGTTTTTTSNAFYFTISAIFRHHRGSGGAGGEQVGRDLCSRTPAQMRPDYQDAG